MNSSARSHDARCFALVLLAFAACGGRSQRSEKKDFDDSDAAAAWASSEAGGDAAGAGTPSPEQDSDFEAAGAAGEAPTPYVSLIRSGTRSCQNEDDCLTERPRLFPTL